MSTPIRGAAPQMAQYAVQNTTRFVCPRECVPRLLTENVFLEELLNSVIDCMNREVHVRFREEPGVKVSLLTLLIL